MFGVLVNYELQKLAQEHRMTHDEAAEYFEQREKERDRKRWGQMAMDYMQGKRDNMNLEDLSTVTTRKGGWKGAFNPKEMKRDAKNAAGSAAVLATASGLATGNSPLGIAYGGALGGIKAISENIRRAREYK